MIQASASGQVYVIRKIDGLDYVLVSIANSNIKNLEQELTKLKEENEKLKSHLDKAESLIEPMTGEHVIPYTNEEVNARIWIADKEELFGKKCTSCNINKAENWNEYGDHLCKKCDEALGE